MAYHPDERLTLADQFRLLAQIMPEDEAKARLSKAFRLREIRCQPLYAVSYEDALIDFNTGKVFLPKPVKKTFMPTLTATEFGAHFPQVASARAWQTNATNELPGSEAPSADRPPRKAGTSGKPAAPTASYLEVRSAVEKHGRDTERNLLRAVGKAQPGKHVPRERVRNARDDLFGKTGRTGRPKSPK
jgi:hypothetical protein